MKSEATSVLEVLSQAALFQKVGEICETVNSVLTTKQLLEVSLHKTLELFSASRGSIFILDDEGKNLVLQIAEGMQVEEEKTLVKRLGEGVVGRVAELKKPIFVEDISCDNRFKSYQARKSYRTSSFICAPLMVKNEIIGVINITDKESGHKFIHEEIQLLDFLSTQIALNYRRIDLYQEFKRVMRETRNLKNKLGESDQETALLKKQIYIQDKLATIGKLAGGIAHEFNNPLDGVLRYTNLCLDTVKNDDVLRGYLLEIKHGLNRMASIVKNLLACSRNDILKSDMVSFEKVLDFSISALHTDISSKEIIMEKNIEKGLPPIRDLGLERILMNLLRNALDAIPDKGKISISAKHEQEMIIVEISDTGRGIPKEKFANIFEPFFTTKDMEKGCGLGLTIVGEIVKAYNGDISVESEQGSYTKFKVTLPLNNYDNSTK